MTIHSSGVISSQSVTNFSLRITAYDYKSDPFQFRVNFSDKPVTRIPKYHGILFTVSSIFDPMSMVSPFYQLVK